MEMIKNWDGVTIKMYQELNSIQRESDVSTAIERISVLMNTDPAEVRNLPVPKFQSMVSQLGWIDEKPATETTIKFEVDGKKYGIIPDLNFITTGEWADIENWKEDSITNMHLIAALLYRPIIKEDGDDYQIEEHKSQGFMKRAELFLNEVSISTIYGSLLFFSASGINFIEIMADYLEETAEEDMKNSKKKKTQTIQSPSKKSK
jgi:hypothetical protein